MSIGTDLETSTLFLMATAIKRLLNNDQVDKALLWEVVNRIIWQAPETRAPLLVEALQPMRSCPECPATLTDDGYLIGYHRKDCPKVEVSAFGELEEGGGERWAFQETMPLDMQGSRFSSGIRCIDTQSDYEEVENFFSEENNECPGVQ